MIDDEQVERLLRARPARDGRYEPALAEMLDADRGGVPVVGTLRWQYGNPGLARLLPVILLIGALLVAATALLVGGTRPDHLVVTKPSPSTVTPAPLPNFPAADLSVLLETFTTGHWADTPDVIVDVSVQRDDQILDGGHRTDAAVRLGATEHLFIATAVLLLAERGTLDIDAPVSRYLTDWPGGAGITVRDLLDGSSGVAAFAEPVEALVALVASEPSRAWTGADALRLASGGTARFVPGARHALADTDDVLLVAIIEAATGSSLYKILVPAYGAIDPHPSDAVPPDPSMILPVAGLWDPTGSGTLVEVADVPPDVVAVLGSGRGLALAGGGLARLADDSHTHPLLLSGSSRALLDRTFDEGGFGGIAMCPCTDGSKAGVGLAGHTGPYTALVVYVPSERLTISIVANAAVSDDDLQGLLQEIHDLVWPAIR